MLRPRFMRREARLSNWYIDRDSLKAALTIPATTTGDHALLGTIIEGVSRQFDHYLGFAVYPSSGVRYYTAKDANCLYVDAPLTAVDSIQTDVDGDTTYETTMQASNFYLAPLNASMETPPRPYWEIKSARNASTVFPPHADRGVKVTGTWGYTNKLNGAVSPTLATAAASGTTTLEINGATTLHAGQTILIGGERMFITSVPRNASDAATTSGITVERAVNGTSAVAHTCATTISVYEYPVFSQAALYQAQQDYRVKDAPLGVAGADAFGTQRPITAGGMHPFVRRMLEPFRMPVMA